METKYLMWAISTVRDVFLYNDFKQLTKEVIKRIEKEMSLVEDAEDTPYTKEMFLKSTATRTTGLRGSRNGLTLIT